MAFALLCSAVVLLVTPQLTTAVDVNTPCKSNLDCSLNGVCASNVCACDKPWSGPGCGQLTYKVTPASGKNLYNTSDPRNTWNGPIVKGPDGKFHLFDPIYKVKSLGGPTAVLHGIADTVTGPYNWEKQPSFVTGGENPAFVTYIDPDTQKTVYSLWIGGNVWLADSLYGKFTQLPGFKYVGGNPAPIYYKGSFYMTNQKTFAIYVTEKLVAGAKWDVYANVSHTNVPSGMHPEDPFMWIDSRNNWHVINHAYNTGEKENCGGSMLSDHFYSEDGKDWHMLPGNVEPYSHTVQYDDGTSHTYTTLERPNAVFNSAGQMEYLNLAADLITGNEGCAPNACTNCKYDDHAGTIIIALDV